MAQTEYNALFVILNKGFTDRAMNAAIEEGARGGTIIHARGAGNSTMTQRYNVPITPEKEIVMMVLKTENLDRVTAAVDKAVGLLTDAHGVCFSVPVSSVTGFKFE